MPAVPRQGEQQPGRGADDVLRHHDGDCAQTPVSTARMKNRKLVRVIVFKLLLTEGRCSTSEKLEYRL